MLASAIPTKFPIPFANNAGVGYIRPIPTASQIGIIDGAASLHDGFPPLNFQPIGSGGVPPFGQDMNGIMFETTAWCQWVQAGGASWYYDATFATNIGGYPRGALLQNAGTQGRFWLSTADNNASNPDTGGANWLALTMLQSDVVAASFNQTLVAFDGSTSGNWTVPNNVAGNRIRVRMWGAGGGGGGAAGNGCGAAAGNGADFIEFDMAVTPGANLAYVVPGGGAGGVAGAAGTNGAACTFAGVASASGGLGGAIGTVPAPGLVGTDNPSSTVPANGRKYMGARGGQGLGPANTLSATGGYGGTSPQGGGGGPGATGQGYNATSPGGGGGGGGGLSALATNGGAGGAARLEIYYIQSF